MKLYFITFNSIGYTPLNRYLYNEFKEKYGNRSFAWRGNKILQRNISINK